MSLDFTQLKREIPLNACLVDPHYYIWGASLTRGTDGSYHLFYSRWPRALGFFAWVTHSEIAHAVSSTACGPFETIGTALGSRDGKLWDGVCVHNPTIHFFEGKYFLYYMGLTCSEGFRGDIDMRDPVWWKYRNRQRIGVAEADSPYGIWKRSETPLIDIGVTSESHDSLLVSNPAVTRMRDGNYLMIYKAVGKQRELPKGGPVCHLAAIAEHPNGPFRKMNQLIFNKEGIDFPAEDPFIWYSPNEDQYYAIVKDMEGCFTGRGKSLALFESEDGLQWDVSESVLVSDLKIEWEDGTQEMLSSLERPQLWSPNGTPEVLFLAASRDLDHSFNVHMPLRNSGKKGN